MHKYIIAILTVAYSTSSIFAAHSAPEISVKANSNPAVPLAAIAEIKSQMPSRVELHVSDGEHTWSVSLSEYKSHHEVPVLGMRPAREHSITVELIDSYGNREKLPIQKYTTPALPYGLERPFPHVQWLPNGNVVISQSINALGLLNRGFRGKTASGFVAEVDWATKELQLLFRIGAEHIDPNAKFDPAKPNWSIGHSRRLPSLYFGKASMVTD